MSLSERPAPFYPVPARPNRAESERTLLRVYAKVVGGVDIEALEREAKKTEVDNISEETRRRCGVTEV